MKNVMLIFSFLLSCGMADGQKITLLDSSRDASYRGLSVVDSRTIWVSGSNGTVGLSTDGGNTWKFKTVKGFEKSDFRDIEAFDKKTAIIMGTSRPACILKTTDAGESWTVVYQNTDTAVFLDAMEFWNDMSGIVVGDPLRGRVFVARTFDGADTWQVLPDHILPVAANGEVMFAASGTNVRKLKRDEAVFVSGGMQSNLFKRDRKIRLPIKQGVASAGANSVAIHKKNMIVTGGDFNHPADTSGNCAISFDSGETWQNPSTPPGGYRSCVEHIARARWITCGLTGVDISDDNGRTWKAISSEPFHVVRKAKKGKAVFMAGGRGRIAKLE